MRLDISFNILTRNVKYLIQ